ncbi:MAG: oligosaccharide flippase family protein [Clostridia bacterium]|nr:oligosaccharide flippase family protein [Clostridia bacterium]
MPFVLFCQNGSYNNTMKNAVYTNATIVTALSVAERSLGFLYRIVLSRLIGAEGLGLYQVALSIFSLFMTVGTGGIPITVSRMIAKSKAENSAKGERSAVSAGICLCLLLTVPVCLIFGLFRVRPSFLFADKRSYDVFRILLVGLSVTCVYAVFRGSFWGNKRFLLPSVIEVAEETVMVIVGVLLLQNVATPLDGAKKAAWAVVISYLFSFVVSTLSFFFCGGKLCAPKKSLKPLFNATMPITSVRASSSLVNSAIAVLLPAMLVRAGIENGEALRLFGIVSGMAMPILFVPSTLIGALSLVLVPELSEDFYRKNYERLHKNIARGIHFAVLLSCILIPFFYAVGEDLARLAFSNAMAGEIVVKGCVILLPMSLTMITTGMLNSLGFEKQTFLFYFIGAAAMLLCVLFLPPFFGVYAYVIGLGASFFLNAVCNLTFLHKKCQIFEKRRGHVRVQIFLPAFLSVLPLCLLGQFFDSVFKRFCGQLTVVVCVSTLLALSTLLVYTLTGAIPLVAFLKKLGVKKFRIKKRTRTSKTPFSTPKKRPKPRFP